MSAFMVNLTAAALGETGATKGPPSAVKLGHHPFIQSGFRRAATVSTKQILHLGLR